MSDALLDVAAAYASDVSDDYEEDAASDVELCVVRNRDANPGKFLRLLLRLARFCGIPWGP